MRITYAHGSRFYRYFCITVLFIFQTDMSPKWFWIQNEYSNDGKQQHLTSIRPKDIKTRHVKIIRYLQSWIAMSIDFEQQISHNAFRLLYARKSKPYSHAHTCATTRGKIIAERLKWTKNWRILIEVFSLFQNFSTILCDVKMRPRNIGNNFQFWFTPCMQRRSNQMHLSNL